MNFKWVQNALGVVFSSTGLIGIVVLVVVAAGVAYLFGVDVAGLLYQLVGYEPK